MSTFDAFLAHKFFTAFAKVGGTPAHVNRLAADPVLMQKVLLENLDVTVLTVTGSTCSWRRQKDRIHFSVTSAGTTGMQWYDRLRAKRSMVDRYAQDVLKSEDVWRLEEGETIEVVVLYSQFFSHGEHDYKSICGRDNSFGEAFGTLNHEVACIICNQFTIEDMKMMGLSSIVVMSEPVEGKLLSVEREPNRVSPSVMGLYVSPDTKLLRPDIGFAFVSTPCYRLR